MSDGATTPPVEKITDGLWCLRVPVPDNPIGYVLTYAFDTGSGCVLVDPGWDSPEVLDTLGRGLRDIGTSLDDVQGVLVTHVHPDHYGIAGRIRELSGAWIGLHADDAAQIRERYSDIEDLLERNRRWLREAGAPADAIDAVRFASVQVMQYVLVAPPDRLVADGERLPVDGWGLRAIHTPGHTPGHLCFHERRERLLLTGDHVLPRITPNVGLHPLSGPDPLTMYLRSLDRLRELEVRRVLPGHEWTFTGLEERLTQIRRHHQERLRETATLLEGGAETSWEVASRLGWSQEFGSLPALMKRAALSEALAHLRELEVRGRVAGCSGTPTTWHLLDAKSFEATP